MAPKGRGIQQEFVKLSEIQHLPKIVLETDHNNAIRAKEDLITIITKTLAEVLPVRNNHTPLKKKRMNQKHMNTHKRYSEAYDRVVISKI